MSLLLQHQSGQALVVEDAAVVTMAAMLLSWDAELRSRASQVLALVTLLGINCENGASSGGVRGAFLEHAGGPIEFGHENGADRGQRVLEAVLSVVLRAVKGATSGLPALRGRDLLRTLLAIGHPVSHIPSTPRSQLAHDTLCSAQSAQHIQ
jgi:hypothetical protein